MCFRRGIKTKISYVVARKSITVTSLKTFSTTRRLWRQLCPGNFEKLQEMAIEEANDTHEIVNIIRDLISLKT